MLNKKGNVLDNIIRSILVWVCLIDYSLVVSCLKFTSVIVNPCVCQRTTYVNTIYVEYDDSL